MANRNQRYFSNAWGARSDNPEPSDNDDIEVIYHSLSSNPDKPGSNNLQPSIQGKRLPIPKLISTAPSNPTISSVMELKGLETNITYSVNEFELVARQTLEWYGFKDYLCVSTFETWFKRYLEHIRTYSNRLSNCIDQIDRDYAHTSVHIPRQQAQDHIQERKPLYYGKDYMSIVFAKPNKSASTLFGGISIGSNEETIEWKLKTITTTLQQVLLDPSNGSLSVPTQPKPLFPKQGQDRNEENAYKNKWNPINCDIPFPVFVRHVQHRFDTHQKKKPLPHFDIEIFKLRYVEHMAQVEKNDKLFLLAVVTAYGHDITTYPLRVMEFLKRTKVFRPGSKPFNTDYGTHSKAFVSIDLSGSQSKNDDPPETLRGNVNPALSVGYSTVPQVAVVMQPPNQLMALGNQMFGQPRPLLPLPPSQNSNFGQGISPDYGYGNQQGPGYRNQQGPGYGNQQGSGYGNQGPGYGNPQGSGYGNQGPGYGNPQGSGYGNQQGSDYANPQDYGNRNMRNTSTVTPLMSAKVDSPYSIANDPTKVLRNPINPDEPQAKRIRTALQNNKPPIPIEKNNYGPRFQSNPDPVWEPPVAQPRITRNQGMMNTNYGPPHPQGPMNSNFEPLGPPLPRNQNVRPPFTQLPMSSNFGPPAPPPPRNLNFGPPGPQGLMNSNFGPPFSQGMGNSVNRPLLPQPVPEPGYQMPYNTQYSTQTNQVAPIVVNPINGNDKGNALNSVGNNIPIPNQMKNLIQAAVDNSKRSENNPSKSNSEHARISFEMPFDIWKIACERARSTVHNQLSSAPLQRLSEEEYKLWYARYLYHVEENYDNFLQGIISGFPPPNYPREIRDMITHRQLMEEGKCEARTEFEDEDEEEDNGADDTVLYDYGHSTSSSQDRQFQQSSFHNPVNPKSNSKSTDSYKYRKY